MRILVYTTAVVLLDQLTKFITRTFMSLGESIQILDNFFRLTYVENTGIAFGINFKGGPFIFTITSIIAVFVVIIYLWIVRKENYLLRISLALILGGAIGNLIDRILFGKVVDFFHFSIGKYEWPVFNIADSSVTIGMFLFLYISFFKTERVTKKTAE